MEPVIIDFEYLRGRQNEMVVKEAAVAGENVSESFRFEPPYYMAPHGSVENGLNWDDGNVAYDKLSAVLKEAVAGFAQLRPHKMQLSHRAVGAYGPRSGGLQVSSGQETQVQTQLRLTLSQTSRPQLRDQERAFPLRLVDVPPADQILRHVPSGHVTSQSQFISAIGTYSHYDWSIDVR